MQLKAISSAAVVHFLRARAAAWLGITALVISGDAAHAATQDILGIGSTSLSVAQTSVDFFSVGGPNTVDLGTSTGAFGALGGTTATLQNISFSGGSISNFVTIPALPQAQFTLTGVEPGVANTNCVALAVGGSCSATAGSPFILTRTSTGTGVSFSAFGTVKDSSAATANFGATFSTEVIGQTPSIADSH
jgi:hypothetical protein